MSNSNSPVSVSCSGLTWSLFIDKRYRHWSEIRPSEQCPFTFTQDELHTHTVEGKGWNETADFWSSISGLVGRDGFVLEEDYNEAFEMFANLRKEGLRTLEGGEKADFEQATTWAVRR